MTITGTVEDLDLDAILAEVEGLTRREEKAGFSLPRATRGRPEK